MPITQRLNLVKEIEKNSLLLMSLQGMRAVLKRELNLKEDINFATDEKIKQYFDKSNQVTYPLYWLEPSDAKALRDRQNNHAVRKYGMRMDTLSMTKHKSFVSYVFPIQMGWTLKYVESDPVKAMMMAETFLILSMINKLGFRLSVGSFETDVMITIPEDVTIPISDTSDYTKPGGIELAINLILETKTGFFKQVDTVINETTISYEMQLNTPDEGEEQ